jgi:hypothetical protein
VHLRRALLLFAIVLGLAAVAASVSRPGDDSPSTEGLQRPPTTPTVEPTPETGSDRAELFFDVSVPAQHGLRPGQAGTVYVSVPTAGQVTIPDLGLNSPADPVTPARFEVLTSRAGRYPISFDPAGAGEAIRAGTVVVAE